MKGEEPAMTEFHMIHGRWALFFPETPLDTPEQRIALMARWSRYAALLDAAEDAVSAWAEGADLHAALDRLATVVSDSQEAALEAQGEASLQEPETEHG